MESKISLNPVTISQCNFEESLEIALKAGFGGIGLRFNLIKEYLTSGHTLKEAKGLLEKTELTTTEMGFLSGWMFHNGIPLAGKRERTGEKDSQLIEEMEFLFHVAKELGSPPITALVELNEAGPFDKAVNDFAWLCDQAEKYGLRIMLEFSGNAPQINRLKYAWELIKKSERNNAGILLDSFLMFLNDLYLEDLDELPLNRIFGVHISDAMAKPKKELNMLKDRLIPGKGIIPLKSFVKKIKEKGYIGFYTIEIFNEEYNKKDPFDVALEALQAVEKLLTG